MEREGVRELDRKIGAFGCTDWERWRGERERGVVGYIK